MKFKTRLQVTFLMIIILPLVLTCLAFCGIGLTLMNVQRGMPIFGFVNAAYFTLRAGGKTVITFLFDSAFMWVATIPVVFVLSRYTGMGIVWIYLICQLTDLIKCAIGFVLVRKGVWIQNMALEEKSV